MVNKKLMFVFVFSSLLCVEFGLAEEGDSPTEAERTAVKALVSIGATVQIDGDFSVTTIRLGAGFNGQVTDEDLKLLASLPSLKSLTLMGRGVTDSGLKHLEKLNSLQTLTLSATSVTDEGIAALKQALPDCRISGIGDRSFGSARGRFNGTPRQIRPTLQSQITDGAVQADLKLSAEQIQKIQAILAPPVLSVLEFSAKLRDATTDEERRVIRDDWEAMQKSADDARRRADEAIPEILSADQLARLNQILLQSRGLSALTDVQVIEQLNLSKEQVVQVAEAMVSRPSSRFPTRNDPRIRTILTEEQQAKWNELTGPALRTPGPRIETQLSGRSPLPGKTPKETAEIWFDRFDRDNDGQLTSQEWQNSVNIRRDFTNAGVDLSQPMSRDEFIGHYLRIRHPEE